MSEPDAKYAGFRLGVLTAAWFLQHGHGEDLMAEELLGDVLFGDSVPTLRRLARRESLEFKRGFWSDLQRRKCR